MVVIMKMIIIAIKYMVTCHGNRSSEGYKTGSNVDEVGKDFEGEGGEDQWQTPHEDYDGKRTMTVVSIKAMLVLPQHSPQPDGQAAKQH